MNSPGAAEGDTPKASLDEQNRWLLECLDVVVSQARALRTGTTQPGDTRAVLARVSAALRRLVPFKAIGFIDLSGDSFEWSFLLLDPADRTSEAVEEVNHQIESDAFAWALAQNRPVILPGRHLSRTIVLHTLATPRRTVGMFIGAIDESFIPDAAQKMISALLIGLADVLDNLWLVERLHAHNKNLEQLVESRTQDLRAARDQAQAASRSKSEFLANMSHELRTPLTAVIGFSQLLEKQAFGPMNEKQTGYVRHILNAGRHLLDLINDILDLSKVEAGKMDLSLSRFLLVPLLEACLVFVKEKALKHGISIETRFDAALQDVSIEADERKLKQIMYNLLSNAVKFTPEGGSVTVGAGLEEPSVHVSVVDTGIGIDPKDQNEVFVAFKQIDSSYAKKQQGTGLGLALTRRMVELHGGRIWLESEGGGKGCALHFTMPLRQSGGLSLPEALPLDGLAVGERRP